MHHFDVNTGFCESVTHDECAAIAKKRNIKMIEIRNPNLYLFPKGCYHKQTNDRIYFNIQNSKKECTWKRICICKKGIIITWSERMPLIAVRGSHPMPNTNHLISRKSTLSWIWFWEHDVSLKTGKPKYFVSDWTFASHARNRDHNNSQSFLFPSISAFWYLVTWIQQLTLVA